MGQSTLKAFFLSSKFLLTFYILVQTGLGQANETPFQPHMIFHPIQGCPANSMCNEEMGKTRQEWLSLVKQVRDKKKNIGALEEFRKNHGLPFNVWLKGDLQSKAEQNPDPAEQGKLHTPDKNPVAYWDSPCEFHRKQEHPIHTAQIFLKDLVPQAKATAEQQFHGMIEFQKAYLFGPNTEKDPSEFIIPRDEFPLTVVPKKLIFLMEEDGTFFHLSIGQSGETHITDPTMAGPKTAAESITCPDYALRPLSKVFDQEKDVYQVTICRQYLNNGQHYLLVVPSGCY